MRVLVTGHHGYLGSVLLPFLVEAGHDVAGLDTLFFEECTFGRDESPIAAVRKDLRDVTAADVAGFDAIVHLAALSNDPLGDLNADWTADINHAASVRLARSAREAGVRRFLYASSCSMYGAAGHDLLTEDAPFNPLTPYAASKVRTEEDLARMADDRFSPIYMRNATAYGVSPRLRADIVLNNLVGWAYTTGKVRILSDGTPWRPLVHAEDIAQACVAMLAAPREAIHNQAFNVGANDENYQVRDLAEIVRQTVPACEIEYAGVSGSDPRNYRVDFSKITRLLPGFRPRWNARRGAKQLYEAYRLNGLTADEFQGRKYIRITQLRYLIESGRLDSSLRWSSRSIAADSRT